MTGFNQCNSSKVKSTKLGTGLRKSGEKPVNSKSDFNIYSGSTERF